MLARACAPLLEPPGSRLLTRIPLRFIKAQRRGGSRGVYAELNLTSMVDMLTILVVFLLQTFSASGELMAVQRDIRLPQAQHHREMERAPIIAVSREVVTLNGEPKASTEELRGDRSADLRITGLHDDLVTLRNNYRLLHPEEPWRGDVIVQADQSLDFRALKRVLHTCTSAGYANVNLAVVSGSR